MINNEIKGFKAKLVNTDNLKCAKYIGEEFDCLLGVFLCLSDKTNLRIKTSLIKDVDKNDYPLLKIKTLNSVYELEVLEED